MTKPGPYRAYNYRVIWLSLLYALFLIGAAFGLGACVNRLTLGEAGRC